jgi:hypothetical protein
MTIRPYPETDTWFDAGALKARDGVWRCHGCEPPAFPGEIVEDRPR